MRPAIKRLRRGARVAPFATTQRVVALFRSGLALARWNSLANPARSACAKCVAGITGFGTRSLASTVIAALLITLPVPIFAEVPADYVSQMARVDYLIRQREFMQAADELGKVPKQHQQDVLFQKYVERVLAELENKKPAALPWEKRNQALTKTRVTRRKKDSNRRSDQTFDNRGWQVNQHVEADVEGKGSLRARYVLDVDGYKNGHNDVRYRTLLADFYNGPNHLAFGDAATFMSPYFMRGSRARGVHLLLQGEVHEFQMVGGAYPYWLEDRDQYIYPRYVFGIRDRLKFAQDRIHLGANFVKTRDTGQIRTIDVINQPRDNQVYSLDQEIKLIEDVWLVRSAQAYSYTDERLDQERFGDARKLKDTAWRIESLLLQPWGKVQNLAVRTGPDFRLLVDLPSGSVLNSKSITADQQLFENFVDFNPCGPFDLDVQASFIRNNLDDDREIGQTRQAWYTANLGIDTPAAWPRPRLRGTVIDTVSVPGSTTRPSQTRLYQLRSELTKYIEGVDLTAFTEYEGDFPQRDNVQFSPEEKWSFGTRASAPFLDRWLVSPHYTYRITDEIFDEDRVSGTHHEAGISNSVALWSTASLGLGYVFQHGKLASRSTGKLIPIEGHSGTVNFSWPYTRYSWNKRKKLTIFPGLTWHLSRLSRSVERRPLLASRLSLAYEKVADWKLELTGEFRYDSEKQDSAIKTEENRFWLLWTKYWRESQTPGL